MTEPRIHAADVERIGDLSRSVRDAHPWLRDLRIEQVLDFLDELGRTLADTKSLSTTEGIVFLSYWLRRSNLAGLLESALPSGARSLDGFVSRGNARVRAYPSGLVAHWPAGNIPTQAVFSWLLAVVTKNASIVRVSRHNREATERLLAAVARTRTPTVEGTRLLGTCAFVHFDNSDIDAHRRMSLVADTKVVWGGEEAVQTVTGLPRQAHCNEIVFGPKYSIAVIDAETVRDVEELQRALVSLARDSIAFEQGACSSPQTLFFEAARDDSARVLDAAATAFESVCAARPKAAIDPYTASEIIKARAWYGLAEGRDVRASAGTDWTLLLDHELTLKPAIQSRTLFLTPVASLMDVPALLSQRVQTVGMAIRSHGLSERFADAAGRAGVSRCVPLGTMHAYDIPWDGRLVLGDLVRWTITRAFSR